MPMNAYAEYPLRTVLQVTGITSAFYRDFPGDFHFSGESHRGWEFVYVDSGRLQASAENRNYILRQGEMICHKPGEFHRLNAVGASASAVITCFTCDSPLMEYFSGKILTVGSRQKRYLNDVARLGKQLLNENGILSSNSVPVSPIPETEQQLKNVIEVLILSLLSAETTDREARIEHYAQYRQRQTMSDEIRAYLREHLSDQINLDHFSQAYAYSLSSIRRIFREETGKGIITYLRDLRMETAKDLLRSTSLSVTDVSAQVGYANVFYFSNAFKAYVGLTPSEYRAQGRKK